MSALKAPDAYCSSCGEDVEATRDKRCPKCGGLTLGPVHMNAQHYSGNGHAVGHVAVAPIPTPIQVVESLIARLEAECSANIEKQRELSKQNVSRRRMLVHLQNAVKAGLRTTGSESAGNGRWSGAIWGKCRSCGSKEKEHARTGYCVECVGSVAK